MNTFNIYSKTIRLIINITLLLFIIYFSFQLFNCVSDAFPREYRDATNIQMAYNFQNGIIPYNINNNHPIEVNVYGFVNPLIVAFLSTIFGINIITTFYIFNVVCIGLICLLMVNEIISLTGGFKKENVFWYLLTFIFAYFVSYRLGYISTIPDTLGSLLGIIILCLARRIKQNKLWIISLLTIIEFYIKPYFLFFAIPVWIFYLTIDKRTALAYFLQTFFGGFLSLFLISLLFPQYIAQTILFEFFETNSQSNISGYQYSFKQLFYLVKRFPLFYGTLIISLFSYLYSIINTKDKIVKYYFFILLSVILLSILLTFYLSSIGFFSISKMVKTIVYPVLLILVFSLIVYKEKRVNQNFQINKILEEFKSPVRLYSITIIIASIILIKLGTQQGAWLSYYFQLLFPTLTIFSVTCLYKFYCKCNNNLVLLITCFCCLIWSIFTTNLSCTYLSKNEKEDWYKVENMINSYIENNRDIYLSCLVSPIAILKGQSVESNGHDYVGKVDNHIISKVMKIDNIETIYPALVNMYEYAYNWNLKRNNKFENGEYSLIICDEKKKDYIDKLNYYILTDSVNLHAGQQKWMHYIYKKIEE